MTVKKRKPNATWTGFTRSATSESLKHSEILDVVFEGSATGACGIVPCLFGLLGVEFKVVLAWCGSTLSIYAENVSC